METNDYVYQMKSKISKNSIYLMNIWDPLYMLNCVLGQNAFFLWKIILTNKWRLQRLQLQHFQPSWNQKYWAYLHDKHRYYCKIMYGKFNSIPKYIHNLRHSIIIHSVESVRLLTIVEDSYPCYSLKRMNKYNIHF